MSSLAQVSRLVVLVLVGSVLAAHVELPAWALPLIVLDSPLTLQLSGPWLIAGALMILSGAGTDVLFRLRPGMADVGFRHTAPAWALPSLVAVVAPLLTGKLAPWSALWLLALAGAGVVLSVVLLSEAHAADVSDRYCRVARSGLTALSYAVALFTFTAIYSAHVRTVLSGTATSLVGFLLAVSLLRWSIEGGVSRLWPYAAITALVVGLSTWGLNHVPLDGPVGGGLLLLVFYITTGITQQFIQRDLSRRVLIEFAVAIMLGLLLLFALSSRG